MQAPSSGFRVQEYHLVPRYLFRHECHASYCGLCGILSSAPFLFPLVHIHIKVECRYPFKGKMVKRIADTENDSPYLKRQRLTQALASDKGSNDNESGIHSAQDLQKLLASSQDADLQQLKQSRP